MLQSPHGMLLPGETRDPAPVVVRQVHGIRVVRVTGAEGITDLALQEADALVTQTPGLAVGVRTADCVPLLIEREDGSAVAAVHAGWRGLVAGVIGKAAAALGAPEVALRVHMGPSIGPCCFEVGPDVAERFDGAVVASGSRPRVDLRAAARAALVAAGAMLVTDEQPPCTRCDPRGLPSYRRHGPGTPHLVHWIAVA